MRKDLEFRLYQKGDEENLSQLFKEGFHVDRDSSYWHWKYHQNPCGEHMMVVAIDKGRIIGAGGSIPEKVKVGSNVLLSCQNVDVVILPEYRNIRTLLKMEEIAREKAVKNEIKLNYGFSIKTTFHISTLFLGMVGICPIFNMAKVLNPTPYLRQKIRRKSLTNALNFMVKQALRIVNRKNLPIPRGFKIDEVAQFDHRFDHFWAEEANNYELAIVKDSQYLNWRYIENPMPYKIFTVEQNQSIKGFIVLKCSQEEVKRGRIVDILVQTGQENVIDLLLAKAINYFLEERVDVVTCWMFEHWPISQALQKRGFIKRETPHHLIIRSFMPDLPNEYFMDNYKWYITMGDSDYY